jgi:hypothetical protein
MKNKRLYMVRYLRMERASTDSWITFILPTEMGFIYACNWAEARMPGWEAVSGAYEDPDAEDNPEGW